MASNLVDTRLDLRTPTFGGDDAGWESWCMKFEAYAHLVGLGPGMETAAENDGHIDLDTLNAEALVQSRNLYALLIGKCDGRALSIISLVPRKNGYEAWRMLKKEYEGTGGARSAAILRGILNPRSRWAKLDADGRDINDMLQAWEKDIAQYRIGSSMELPPTILAAAALEHLPAKYQAMLSQIPMTQRENMTSLRAYIREWHLATR